MKKKLISIVINCYNGEKYLQKTLESVLNQNYQNFEVIFLDNCSTDQSSKILKILMIKGLNILELRRRLNYMMEEI